MLSAEVEEARMLLDTAERARRHAEMEVADIREAIGELTNVNSLLTVDKRRLEGDLRGMQQELDELMIQVKNGEEKARKAITDAGKSIFTTTMEILFTSFYSVKRKSNIVYVV